MGKDLLRRAAVVLAVLFGAFALPGLAHAGTGPTYISSTVATAPTLAGSIDSTWAAATPFTVDFGNIAATVRFEETSTMLYAAVTVPDPNHGTAPSLTIFFDNNDDGIKNQGDDAWIDFAGSPEDYFYSTTGTGGASHYNDQTDGGSNDLSAAMGLDPSGLITFEFAHPLCDADTSHDICALPGQKLGIDFQYEPGTGGFTNAPGGNAFDPSNWPNLFLGSDTTAPSVTITQPPVGSTLRGSVAVSADASDNSSVASVHFQYFDGTTQKVYDLGTVTSPPYTVTFDTTTVPDTQPAGSQNGTLYATATDIAGNTTRNGIGVAVDNAAHLGTLHGSLDNNYVFLVGFSPNTAVTGTVLAPTGGTPLTWSGTTDANGALTVPPQGWVLLPGSTLTATVAGVGTTTLTLVDIHISRADLVKNAVEGTAPPGATVRAFVYQYNGATTVLDQGAATADDNGVWSVQFATQQLQAGMHIVADTDFGNEQTGDRSRADYDIPATVTGATVSIQGDPTATAGAASADIAQIPLEAITGSPSANGPSGAPLGGIPLGGIPLGGIPLGGIPLGGIGFTAANLSQNGLGGVPLSTIPLKAPDSWQSRIDADSSDFPSDPPAQSVTLAQVLNTQAANGVTLDDLDLAGSPLGGIPLGGIALGGLPLGGIPLGGIATSTTAQNLSDWCAYINSQSGYSCSDPSTLTNQTFLGLALSGVPLGGIPLGGIPLGGIDLSGTPLGGIPVGTPLGGIPLGGIDLSGTPLGGIPLGGIDMSASPLGGIPLGGIPLSARSSVLDCTGAFTCLDTATLADAAAAGAIDPNAKLQDLGYYCVPGTPADPSCHAGDTPIQLQDLVKGLPPSTSLADLLATVLAKTAYDWESLPLDQIPIQDYAQTGGLNHYTVSFTVNADGSGTGPATVTADLPAGARYVPSSSQLDGSSTSEPSLDTSTNELTWKVDVAYGTAHTLTFQAKPGLTLGTESATASVAAAGIDAVPAPSAASTSIGQTFPGDGAPDKAATIAPDTLYFGYTPNGSDRDYFQLPLPNGSGQQITVHLSHLHVDDDLVVYGPAPQPLRVPKPSTTPTLVPNVTPDLSQQIQPITPEALSDVPQTPPAGDSVLGISDNRGLGDEEVSFIVPEHAPGAVATIQVSSYDGGYSNDPWMLRVEESPAIPLPSTCTTPATTGGGTVEPMPGNVGGSTLYLFNAQRFGNLYGAAAESNIWAKLAALAGRTDAAGGTVIPIDDVTGVSTALSTWYGSMCSPDASNDVVRAIGRYLDTISPTYKYVVIVGDYDVLPPGLVLDDTSYVNERGYASTFLGGDDNAYLAAYALGYLPTDDPYGDTNYSGTGAYVPEAAVGRLVETPDQIAAQIDQYTARGGTVNPTTALVTGYDFLSDGAQLIASNLQPQVASPTTLISETWNRSQLLNDLFPTSGPAPAIDSLNAHYDHHRALPADQNAAGTENDLFTTADVQANTTPGRIVITMGCHSGLTVSDLVYPGALGSDWAETYAAGGAIDYVGNTGYGLGETAGVAYSEELHALLAQRLNGSMTVGQALMYAKQEYAGSVPTTSGYQLKVLDEAEMYGLPMYRIGTGTAATPPPTPLPVVTDPVTGLAATQFNLAPSYQEVTASTGDYYTVGGNAAFEDRRPIEPLVKMDVTEPNLVAHGALITGLASTQQSGFDAAFSRVVDDESALSPELVGDAIYPSKLQDIATFASPNGTQQRLLLFGGQFRSGTLDAAGTGTQRLFTSLSGSVLYAAPSATDFTAPTFGPVTATSSGGTTIAFAVDVTDDQGSDNVKRVLALYHDASGSWRSIDLARTAGTSRWSGTGPFSGTTAEWFIQAVDGSGNVGVTSNKADVASTVQPPPSGSISASVSGPQTNGWYTGAATVAVTGAPGIAISVDGGPFTTETTANVDGTGVHTVSFQGSDGSSGSVTVPIDETPPTISIQTGIIPSTATPQVVCSDAGSGIASCQTTPSPLDTSVGTHSVHVVATDRVGNVTQQDGTYTVDAFTGFFSPVNNQPTLNVVKAGSAVPVKFSLGLNLGLSILAPGYPLTRGMNCDTSAPLDTIEQTVTAGSSSLQYDATSNQYTYVWKTSSAWGGGTCRQLVLRLTDGTEHVANFKFK